MRRRGEHCGSASESSWSDFEPLCLRVWTVNDCSGTRLLFTSPWTLPSVSDCQKDSGWEEGGRAANPPVRKCAYKFPVILHRPGLKLWISTSVSSSWTAERICHVDTDPGAASQTLNNVKTVTAVEILQRCGCVFRLTAKSPTLRC